MANPNEEVLEFSVAVDIRNALKEFTRVQVQMAKLTKEILKNSGRTSKEQTKNTKKTKKETKQVRDSVGDVADAYEEEGKQASNLSRVIAALEKRVKKLTGTERDAAEQRLAALKKEEAKRAEAEGKQEKRDKKKKEPKEAADYGFNRENIKKFKDEFKELGSALKEPLQAFLQRDLKGLLEGSMKGAGATLSRSLKMSKFLAGAGAQALSKRGEQMSFKGKKMGGAKGEQLEARGAAMKQMGSMMGKIGGAMSSLAKIGPFLSVGVSLMTQLVTKFIEADSMVKDFNRGIMDSASNLEFLERAGGSAGAAIMNMSDALKGVREGAMDYRFNNALGITKDTHTAILNTLTQEGVALGNLSAEAGNTVEGMKRLTQSIVTMGVGYSRSLGVPIQEITTLQAEMALEMGNSVESTAAAFNNMARAAAGSGIAGNKFFSIIRAASADLSLWNLRLEGAVDVLGKLGKIMSPRGAQQFFQSITSGFKQMGRQDLLKQTLMAGVENVREVLKEDVAGGQKELAEQILSAGGAQGMGLDAVIKQLQGGYRNADKLIRTVRDPSKMGTLRTKAAELERKRQGAAGGTYEVSQASGEIQGVGGQISIMMKAVEKLGGSLLKPNEMALSATADTLGINQEQVRHLHSLALAADAQKKILLDQAKNDPKEQERIAKMTWKELIDSDKSLQSQADSLQKDQTDKQKSVQEAIQEMSKAQGEQTQTLTQKLENLIDWLMSTYYNLVVDIWDAIMSMPFMGGSKDKRTIYKSGNKDAIQSYDKAKDKEGNFDFGAFRDNLLKALGPRLGNLSAEGRGKVAQSVGAVSAGAREKMGERLEYRQRRARILDMAKMSGLGEDKQAKLKERLHSAKNYSGDIDLLGVMKDLGFSIDEQNNLLGKAGWSGNLDNLVDLAESLKGGGAAAVEGPPGPAAPAQVTAEATEQTNSHLETAAQDNKKEQAILQQQGIKIAPVTLKEEAKGMEASMLSALRTALFEFYLYSGTDRGTMLASMKAGGLTDPRQMAPAFAAKSLESGSTTGAVAGIAEAKPNAGGGAVTGIANGMAVVASHGEGLASVGRGERIVPAGGGGSSGVHVSVNGIGGQDLARLIEGKVVEGIREYKRRERLY